MESKRYIYFHKNPTTKKLIYVGVGYRKRAWEFKWGRSIHYKNYINKHGEPIVELYKENLDIDVAYEMEIQLIKKYGRLEIDKDGILLNKSIGGKTSALGCKHYVTQEWKDKIGDANRGKKKHTIKGKQSISNKNSKSILQYDLEYNFIKKFKSIKEASQITNIDKALIDNNLQNPLNKTSQYIWKYEFDSKQRKGKHVEVYDNDWNFIKEYDSINQAERDLKVIGIRQFLKGNSKYVGKNKYKFKIK